MHLDGFNPRFPIGRMIFKFALLPYAMRVYQALLAMAAAVPDGFFENSLLKDHT